MKIAEMTTDQLTDLYVKIAPPLGNIACGEHWDEIAEAIKGCTGNGARMLVVVLPMLLKYNRQDIYGVIGAINGKTAEEIAKQPYQQTLSEARDVFSMDIGSFLSPSVSEDQTA